MGAAGGRGADGDVGGAAEAVQQGRQGGEEDHVRGGLLGAGEGSIGVVSAKGRVPARADCPAPGARLAGRSSGVTPASWVRQ